MELLLWRPEGLLESEPMSVGVWCKGASVACTVKERREREDIGVMEMAQSRVVEMLWWCSSSETDNTGLMMEHRQAKTCACVSPYIQNRHHRASSRAGHEIANETWCIYQIHVQRG
jgi:hypothetical protein